MFEVEVGPVGLLQGLFAAQRARMIMMKGAIDVITSKWRVTKCLYASSRMFASARISC